MATADEVGMTRVGPRVKVDDQGRALPRTPEEQRECDESLRQLLVELKEIENDPNEDDRDFFRAMDEAHPHWSPSYKEMGLY